ncbi:MAG: TIGR02757 family protein [Bacteroidota bacterium]
MSLDELREFLLLKHDQFNQADFIPDDPVSIPHRFDKKEDIEIAGFFSALIAWGRRNMIIRNANRLMEIMEQQPFQYVMEASENELSRLEAFVHRTFNGQDARGLVLSLRRVYAEHGGLEGIFSQGVKAQDGDVKGGILHAREKLLASPEILPRTHKHVANPAKGSSAKRINMFLRWMVRKDKRGVDFGLWEGIGMHQLICPLDVHTGNVARKLGILDRKQNDWKAAAALTETLRRLDADDPVKFDFSLFGLGVVDGF